MKKMNSHQKQRWNKLTSKRRKKHLKRRGHIKRLKLAERKINITRKRIEKLVHLRKKYLSKPQPSTETRIL